MFRDAVCIDNRPHSIFWYAVCHSNPVFKPLTVRSGILTCLCARSEFKKMSPEFEKIIKGLISACRENSHSFSKLQRPNDNKGGEMSRQHQPWPEGLTYDIGTASPCKILGLARFQKNLRYSHQRSAFDHIYMRHKRINIKMGLVHIVALQRNIPPGDH